ncbi:MAG: Gfo/Idh/MocA family protein [Promethearchaeota archaeon]
MKKLRVGLIGAGAIGKVHLAGFQLNKNCELLSIASRTKGHAEAFATRFGIPSIYIEEKWKDMLRIEDLDIVSICTPNYLHAPMILEAIQNDIHILVEKPICITKEELNEIDTALSRNNLILFTAFQKRYIPIFPILKRMIDRGDLGTITLARFMLSHLGPYITHNALSKERWFFDNKKAGGGVLLDLGVHCIDLFHYLIADYGKVEGVSVSTNCIKMKDEDTANVLFKFKNNALGVICTSWCANPSEIIEIFGTRGTIKIDLLARKPLSFTFKEKVENELLKEAIKCKIKTIIPHFKLIDHFIDCIIQGKQESPDYDDGRKAVEFVLEAYHLLKNKVD